MTLYETGTWAGKTNYKCLICPFATLDPIEIEDHVTGRHPGGDRVVQVAPPQEETVSHSSPPPNQEVYIEEEDAGDGEEVISHG